MVQRGRGQLVDLLLIGWWGGKWESASSTFWFQPLWGLRACGQHTVNFSPHGGFGICRRAQSHCYVYPLRGVTRTLPWGCTIVSWLLLPCLCIPSLSWLASVWTCLLDLREGPGGWMKPISCNQEMGMGDTERLLCPEAPQAPAWFHLSRCVSIISPDFPFTVVTSLNFIWTLHLPVLWKTDFILEHYLFAKQKSWS